MGNWTQGLPGYERTTTDTRFAGDWTAGLPGHHRTTTDTRFGGNLLDRFGNSEWTYTRFGTSMAPYIVLYLKLAPGAAVIPTAEALKALHDSGKSPAAPISKDFKAAPEVGPRWYRVPFPAWTGPGGSGRYVTDIAIAAMSLGAVEAAEVSQGGAMAREAMLTGTSPGGSADPFDPTFPAPTPSGPTPTWTPPVDFEPAPAGEPEADPFVAEPAALPEPSAGLSWGWIATGLGIAAAVGAGVAEAYRRTRR